VIPPAHGEYEKMLRQLEAECRNHIRCEQQMKLHMECLQEKIEQMARELIKHKDDDRQIQDLLIQKEVLETNIRHLNERLKLNEQAVEQKD
jgi:hypothetical protein